MKLAAVLALLLLTTTTYSLSNDRAIRAMAQGQKGYTETEIRAEISKGCDGTGNMALCAWYSYYVKDLALNDTYRELMRRLVSTDLKNALRKSQKAWLEFRNSQCLFSTGDWEGGSFRHVAIAMCWEGMTDMREKELAEILRCKEGPCFELQGAKSAEHTESVEAEVSGTFLRNGRPVAGLEVISCGDYKPIPVPVSECALVIRVKTNRLGQFQFKQNTGVRPPPPGTIDCKTSPGSCLADPGWSYWFLIRDGKNERKFWNGGLGYGRTMARVECELPPPEIKEAELRCKVAETALSYQP